MLFSHQRMFSRRGFRIYCAVVIVAREEWLSPSQAYAEARNVVDLIGKDAGHGTQLNPQAAQYCRPDRPRWEDFHRCRNRSLTPANFGGREQPR